jgi:hypothetical protein
MRKRIAKRILSRRMKGRTAVLAWLLIAATAVAQPLIWTQPTNTTTSLAGSAQFRVYATPANPPITYEWWFQKVPLDPMVNPSAAKNLLSLTNVTPATGGPYLVVVSDASGLATTSQVATLTVDPTFTKITTGPGEPKPSPDNACSLNWWDYDNDGFLDLFIACGFRDGSSAPMRNRLHHNNRNGTFTRVTNEISATLGAHVAGSLGDYDNDGEEDLFVSTYNGPQEFFRNNGGGAFTRFTKAHVGSAVGDMDVTIEAAWADFDCDGFLDLFRANGYQSPAKDCLYRNNGNGSFTKMTTNEVGPIVNERAATAACNWGDYDNDGWPDLWALNWQGSNLLYHNERGFFRRVTDPSNSVVRQRGPAGGAAWGDYDNDGFLDLFVSGELNLHALHHNLGGLTFTNVTASAGIPSSHGGLSPAANEHSKLAPARPQS